MDNLKDIQDITGLTSEAIFNIRKPVNYMCSDINNYIKDIRAQCDYMMDGDRLNGRVFQLSPLFVEEMMGYPLMWTTLPFPTGNGEKNQ